MFTVAKRLVATREFDFSQVIGGFAIKVLMLLLVLRRSKGQLFILSFPEHLLGTVILDWLLLTGSDFLKSFCKLEQLIR